ncbi:MAG: carbohydrate-binding domain-containing protein [Treponema sp.]|jgi:hypothetical protein|nr:carbohydrate-binding domain-containing protein [Treponema sp.]
MIAGKGLAIVFLAVAGAAFAKDSLAILPFTGGTAEEGETIAEMFSYSDELKAAWTLIPRTSITRAIGSEWKFQTDTGMTAPDTIMAIGKQLDAQYIVAGNIAKLGALNLLVISILKIDDLRQVAGDIQTYARIGDIRGKLPDMARNIVAAAGVDASRLDKLAVTPVQLRGDVDARVADTLAQVLSINLIRGGKYAVYPRTATLEQVQAEYDNQTDGMTADENVVGIGKGENPRFVLSVAARRLDEQNMFNASIINLESGEQIIGRSVDYQTLDDGVRVMRLLAQELTGVSMNVPSALSLAESLAWIANNAVEGGNYAVTLKNNETLAPQSLSYNGKKVSITLDGGTVERRLSLSANGSLFTIGNGVTLTLGNNVSLRGRSGNTTSLVWVNGGGTLVMESGSKISGNSNTADNASGGGVFVGSGGRFMQNGGGISGNSANYGSGVRVYEGGIWTMNGGEISGNSAIHSSGAFVAGTFTMNGGAISGNSASQYVGGGVGIHAYGTFTMNGGVVSGNSAKTSGGGVYIDGVFILNDGTISGNSASEGGGVGMGYSGVFIKQAGGIIYGSNASGTLKNTATRGNRYGHAVFIYVEGSPNKSRNSTAGSGVMLNGRISGSAGGWE